MRGATIQPLRVGATCLFTIAAGRGAGLNLSGRADRTAVIDGAIAFIVDVVPAEFVYEHRGCVARL